MSITKKKQTHRYKEQTSGYQWGERRGEGQNRGTGLRGTDMHKVKKLQAVLYSTGNTPNIL